MVDTVTSRMSYRAPFGYLSLEARGNHISALHFTDHARQDIIDGVSIAVLQQAVYELDAYFSGALTQFDVPMDAPPDNGFYPYIEALSRVPYGSTVTYKELAQQATYYRTSCDHREGGPRAAARACATNLFPIFIPCHRVVPKNGGIGGFAGSPPVKEWLLTHEQKIINNK